VIDVRITAKDAMTIETIERKETKGTEGIGSVVVIVIVTGNVSTDIAAIALVRRTEKASTARR
jgi:hypothetical protein